MGCGGIASAQKAAYQGPRLRVDLGQRGDAAVKLLREAGGRDLKPQIGNNIGFQAQIGTRSA